MRKRFAGMNMQVHLERFSDGVFKSEDCMPDIRNWLRIPFAAGGCGNSDE